MQVTVFGASGKVGQRVVKILLAQNYSVIAFIHQHNPFEPHQKLRFVRGDIHISSNVSHAVTGSQAVISTLGSWGTKEKDIVSTGIINIIQAAEGHNTLRVVCLTGADALASGDHSNLLQRMQRLLIYRSPARKILVDGEQQINVLQKSKLQWTVLRSPIMTNAGSVNQYVISNKRPSVLATINRDSVALALVELLHDQHFINKAPYIARK